MYVCTCMQVYARQEMYVCTCMQVYARLECMSAHACRWLGGSKVSISAYTHTYIIHTYIHIYTHTYTNAYMHIHIHIHTYTK